MNIQRFVRSYVQITIEKGNGYQSNINDLIYLKLLA